MAKKKPFTVPKLEDNLIPNIKTKDRYCKHLTPEENQMLDIMADIIAGYVIENAHKKNADKRQ